ncbi:MAG: dihydropteroate synthase [Prevotellaceae bacterium]|jgi:dihydropteroate synthase|nr:dihydropteroate synthase [Prevotellaceae bacterium]
MEEKPHFLHKKTMLRCGDCLLSLASPVVMGILNVTPDSFYANSRTTGADAIAARAHQILSEGAAIIDVGAYSSRPNAADVSPEEELRRLDFALNIICKKFPQAIISIDTFRAEVVRQVVRNFGAIIVNDIAGGDADEKMHETVAELSLPYIAMHMRGTPQTMQQHTNYADVVAEVILSLSQKVNALHALGVADVVVDPGFGFAKTVEQNFELLRRLDEFKIFELPLLAGLSRKSMICRALNVQPSEALNGTTALNALAVERGADILRVHDVKEAVEVITLVTNVTGNE